MNSIVIKLGLSIVFLIMVVLLPLGYVVDKVFTNFYYDKAVQSLHSQSEKLIVIMKSERGVNAAEKVMVAMRMTNHGTLILDGQFQVVARSNEFPNGLVEQFTTTDWETLKEGSAVIKTSDFSEQNYIWIAKPVIVSKQFSGVVLMVTRSEDIQASVVQIREFLLLSGIGTILLALGFTWIVVKKLSNPLLEMERATRRIARGDLEVRIAWVSHDELGSLATAINDLATDLKRYHDTRTEFFANISHELRTPLTYIEGYIRLLRDEDQQEKDKKQALQVMTKEAQRLKGLVHDLFELSKLEEGKMALILEWIDLNEVIENARQSVELRAKKKGLHLEFLYVENPLMYLDGDRMQQIFMNLLDNAIRYTVQGSITIQTEKQNEYLLIEISDTGMGIPKEDLPLIFERFHRVEKSRSRDFGGTGLGLAIVKKLVELQGGSIDVSSKIGVGTTFTMSFPLPPEERSE